MHEILRKAFITPFTSKDRIRLYLGAVLGCASFAGLILYFAFDFLNSGPWVLAAYYVTKSFLGNVFFMPFLFWLAQQFPERSYFKKLVIFQIIVLCLMVLIPFENMSMLLLAFVFGLLFTLFSCAYWVIYHVLVIHSSTDENLGNEVSIAAIGTSIGSMIGYALGGVVFAYFPGNWFIFLCFALMIGSSILLLSAIPAEIPAERRNGNVLKSFLNHPWRSINTMLDGSAHFLISFFAPVWLGFIGLSSLASGFISALGIVCKLICSPFIGHWFHTTRLRESKIGTFFISVGWVPWIFLKSPWVLSWSYLFWSTGTHMYSVGLQSRWYKDKTYANMAAREVSLGIGRSITCIIALYLIHLDVQYFFIMALLFALITFFVTTQESKTHKQ